MKQRIYTYLIKSTTAAMTRMTSTRGQRTMATMTPPDDDSSSVTNRCVDAALVIVVVVVDISANNDA